MSAAQPTIPERIRASLSIVVCELNEYDASKPLDPAKGPYTQPTGTAKLDVELERLGGIADEIERYVGLAVNGWDGLTDGEIFFVLSKAPSRIAGPWVALENDRGASEFFRADARVGQEDVAWVMYRGRTKGWFAVMRDRPTDSMQYSTADEAKSAADARLRDAGWRLA